MNAALRLIAGLAALLAAPAVLAAGLQHAFLVQNSGWMAPFYVDPASRLKPLVSAVVTAAVQPQDGVFLAAFNEATPDNPSPVLLQKGRGPIAADAALAPLRVAVKNKATGALADTNFQQAVVHSIKEYFGAQPGIVWIFTNNRNSPGNDPQTLARNRDFYRLLHDEPSISRSLAFPLKMVTRSQKETASGLMVYALAYGEEASAQLAALVAGGALAKVFVNPPARLKPTDQESLRLVPRDVAGRGVKVSLGPDGRTLVVDVSASDAPPRLDIRATVENLSYPYTIASAKASAALRGAHGTVPVGITPGEVSVVAPGERREVAVGLPLQAVPSAWSREALMAMGRQVIEPAVLEVVLSDQRLVLSDGFTGSMRELFGSDPLMEVFQPSDRVRESRTSVPILLRIQYPLTPVVLAIAGALALVGGVFAAFALAGRSARFDIVVDGMRRSVAVKAFGSAPVRTPDGRVIGTLRRGLGRPSVADVAAGHVIDIPR